MNINKRHCNKGHALQEKLTCASNVVKTLSRFDNFSLRCFVSDSVRLNLTVFSGVTLGERRDLRGIEGDLSGDLHKELKK